MPTTDPLAIPTTPPPPGMINVAPGSTTQTPGTQPPGGQTGIPVTSYNPAMAQASTATGTTYTPKPFTVSPDATVKKQLYDIIDENSPLMRQAEAYAKETMADRGLLSSSMAIQAGHGAVMDKAMPIATADAATYDRAATNTTTAENRALEFGATTEAQARQLNAQLATDVSKTNAGQANAAMSQAATASNQASLTSQQIRGNLENTAMQIQGQKDLAGINNAAQALIEQLRSDTSLTIADKNNAAQLGLAQLQANTQLTLADKTAAINKYIADLQNSTTITVEQAKILSQQAIAKMQTDATLTIEQQKDATARLNAQLNASTALQQQQITNAGLLANIQAKGAIDTRITTIVEANKALIQSNAGAGQLYTQALQNISALMVNTDLTPEARAVAMNNIIATLNDGLAAIAAISGGPTLTSNLTFGGGTSQMNPNVTPPTVTPGTTPLPGSTTTQPTQQAASQADIANLYMAILGRQPDAAGLQYYLSQGNSLAQIEASLRGSLEFQQIQQGLHPPPGGIVNQPPAQQPTTPATGGGMINQPPAATPQPSMPAAQATQALTDAYQQVFGRAPDAQGLAYYQDQIAQGRPVDQIMAELRASPEGQLSNLYFSIFGRAPDTAGMDYWKQQLAAGYPIDQVRATFFNTPESKQPATADAITLLYKQVLGRDPDQGGLQNLLASGMTPFAIYQSMKLSPEYMQAHPDFAQTPEYQWLTTYQQPV